MFLRSPQIIFCCFIRNSFNYRPLWLHVKGRPNITSIFIYFHANIIHSSSLMHYVWVKRGPSFALKSEFHEKVSRLLQLITQDSLRPFSFHFCCYSPVFCSLPTKLTQVYTYATQGTGNLSA